jgi:hypothetical protein
LTALSNGDQSPGWGKSEPNFVSIPLAAGLSNGAFALFASFPLRFLCSPAPFYCHSVIKLSIPTTYQQGASMMRQVKTIKGNRGGRIGPAKEGGSDLCSSSKENPR